MFFNQFQGNRKINNDEYYNILGVDKNADKKTIKKAYHKLAVKCHPDKGGDPDKFKSIAEAFEVLSDPKKTSKIFSKIYREDKSISKLAKKLTK